MTEPVAETEYDLVELGAKIVSAFLSHNALSPSDLPKLIADVYAALKATSAPPAVEVAETPKPAISVRKSVTSDYLICLEDGRKFKSLKRHLRTTYDMSPEDYREKWGLASDYPMVAPNYSAKRSELAKSSGLGRKPGKSAKRLRRTKAAA